MQILFWDFPSDGDAKTRYNNICYFVRPDEVTLNTHGTFLCRDMKYSDEHDEVMAVQTGGLAQDIFIQVFCTSLIINILIFFTLFYSFFLLYQSLLREYRVIERFNSRFLRSHQVVRHMDLSIINYPTVCLCVGLCVTELLPNEGSNLNK